MHHIGTVNGNGKSKNASTWLRLWPPSSKTKTSSAPFTALGKSKDCFDVTGVVAVFCVFDFSGAFSLFDKD